jgi:hypothetical protein
MTTDREPDATLAHRYYTLIQEVILFVTFTLGQCWLVQALDALEDSLKQSDSYLSLSEADGLTGTGSKEYDSHDVSCVDRTDAEIVGREEGVDKQGEEMVEKADCSEEAEGAPASPAPTDEIGDSRRKDTSQQLLFDAVVSTRQRLKRIINMMHAPPLLPRHARPIETVSSTVRRTRDVATAATALTVQHTRDAARIATAATATITHQTANMTRDAARLASATLKQHLRASHAREMARKHLLAQVLLPKS